MKRYAKEIAAILLQAALFYILPLFAGPTDAIGMVFLIIVGTFGLALLLGMLSGRWCKWLYPPLTSLIFLPSVPIYYNESAVVHAMWYLVVSAIGMAVGGVIRIIIRKCFGR